MFASHDFKDILKTDATTEEGEDKVLMYFRVDKNCWTKLLQEWQQEHGTPLVGYERYYKLLYLVKLWKYIKYYGTTIVEGTNYGSTIVFNVFSQKYK